MKTKQIVLSDGEWKLMKLLWEKAPMTLGDMVEAMQDDTAWSKGTIFTMLRRMSAKGAVRMDDSGKYQQYYPVLQKEEAEQTETRSFLERVYDGSVGMMLSRRIRHSFPLHQAKQEKSCIVQRSRKSIRPIQQWRSKAQIVFMRYPLHKLFTKKCLHFIVCSVIVHIEQRK